MKRSIHLALVLALVCSLGACGRPEAGATPAPLPAAMPSPPAPTPYRGPRNPLTGEPMDGEEADLRPVAVMLNNLEQAMPQLGQSQADIIYEVLAEGGITRMLGVYQSVEGLGTVGSIRSARPYYIELALGHDALFLHAGGSEDAYSALRAWGVDHFDSVRGPYLGASPESNMMWRDAARRRENGLEHSVVATGTSIERFLPEQVRRVHESSYQDPQTFVDDGTPAGGAQAEIITVPYSYYKTGVFLYDPESGDYLVEEYGEPYIDGNTGGQVAVTNVLILATDCRYTGDSLGHMEVEIVGEGEGWFACGGRVIPIKWRKKDRESPIEYAAESGKPLALGRGNRYVNIVPLDAAVTFA